MAKPIEPAHIVRVQISSCSTQEDGTKRLNQRITFEEFSDDVNMHTAKNFPIAEKVADGILQANKEIAKDAGFPTTGAEFIAKLSES